MTGYLQNVKYFLKIFFQKQTKVVKKKFYCEISIKIYTFLWKKKKPKTIIFVVKKLFRLQHSTFLSKKPLKEKYTCSWMITTTSKNYILVLLHHDRKHEIIFFRLKIKQKTLFISQNKTSFETWFICFFSKTATKHLQGYRNFIWKNRWSARSSVVGLNLKVFFSFFFRA